jgi:hypothetical protein
MGVKDDCFKEALEEYKKVSGDKDLKIDHQQPWVRDRVTGWRPLENESLWTRTNFRIREILGYTDAQIVERINQGKDNPIQLRRPDFTVNTPEGRTLVIDNKFLDSDCRMDEWGDKPGQSGALQREDYNQINSNNNPDKNVDDLRLDRDVCNCPKVPERVTIEATESSAEVRLEDRMSGMRMWRPVPGSQHLPGWEPWRAPGRPGGMRPVFR